MLQQLNVVDEMTRANPHSC